MLSVRWTSIIMIVVAVVATVTTVVAQTGGPLSGTWTINLANSKYSLENVAMLKGKALTTTRVVVSRDGKTRTNTVTGTDAQGRTINNTVVYEKR